MCGTRDNLFAVIMAGGHGDRFWPAGTRERPKQLLPILGEKTMIEETVQRLFPLIAPENVLVITNKDYVDKIRELLPIPQENVVGEPEARDTAPCVALATALVAKRNPDATMIMLPADHVIRPAKAFQQTLLRAVVQAQNGSLVTLGITPTYAATGYGYLHLGEPKENGFHAVLEFKEKPDASTAKRYFQEGNYRWNSGVFIWTCNAIRQAFQCYQPELSEKLEGWIQGKNFENDFQECPKISIDYAIMEKVQNLLVGEVSFYWNDIGCWSALRSILPLDDAGNALRGNVVTLDATNNVIVNEGEEVIGIIGLRDCAVVRSPNGILVCPLSEEQKVKQLLKEIRKE